ncbi:PREDICTED: disease resistance protein RPM1-like [Nicotiana attenuata]|uniref:Disease resistance protein rpm1 n=1 Tax=Nicotiana attenuata TaxID=49451 RepID=A0A314KTM7_NICAT|nr:PREDICTED: disease resistance protein RPM1-like [Nicotiana attenuata]OIT32688.1 disease resistance protein rpm1 [Nicotiana attenuata]
MAECAISYLVHQLSTLLNCGQKFLDGIQQEIVHIRDAFEQMRTFSRVADAKEEEDAELQVWIKQVLNLAHDVQDILENHIVICNSFQEKVSWPWKKPHHSLMSEKLFEAQNDNILKALEGVKARIIVISEGHNTFLQKYGATTSAESSNITWCNNHEEVLLVDDADLVGVENHKSVLLDCVLSDDPEWKLLCVVGTRGIGKTTLVKKIFDDATVNKHFNHHTLWIDIPKFSDVKELFTSMLDPQDDHSRRALEAMDANMLAQFLQLFFKSSRYLIVLDDVPDIGIWRALTCAFPRESCGSRIIIISRFADICHTICVETDVGSHVYNLKPLAEEESWILFCKKAFSGSLLCPSSLVQISKDIIQKCRGLPLAILVIAGALATKGKRKEAWEMFYDSLVDKLQGSYSEAEHMTRILNLCYQDLPFYLKSCFTYLSIIPRYHVIDKMRLTRLWAAEGLVLEREGKAIAQVAGSYLTELANRSLIQVAKKYPDGRLAIFSIHNLWYEIILPKSGESAMATIANGEERRPHKVRHPVIADEFATDIQNIDRFKHLHSLITFGSPDSVTSSFLLKLLCGSFKLLKVLDLTGAPLVNIPEKVFELVHLKFLNLRNTKIKHLPGSIWKLEYLEFLDLRDTLVNKLPDEILRLQHLRHVLIYRRGADFLHGFTAPEKIGTLVSMEVVTLINATTSIVIELGKLTRLRKLEIAKLRRKHARDLCSSLDKLINLEQLSISSYGVGDIIDLHYPLRSTHSSLRTLTFEGRLERLPIWVTSLEALATVHLRLSKLEDNALETLQDLPNLVNLVLELACEGEELRFRAGRFKKLRELYIWHCRKLRMINVEEGAMPSLEELQLRNCPVMKVFPFGIEHLSKLQRLMLQNVSEKMLMTLQLEDSQSGDYWKIAHIPRVQIVDL